MRMIEQVYSDLNARDFYEAMMPAYRRVRDHTPVGSGSRAVASGACRSLLL
jgi:hypothetical protein